MKIKFLAITASFFIISLVMTSCLGSDNEYELGTDDTISAFALDTIYGNTYKFTIDQVKGEIYNHDSVPFGSDTIINNILIKTLSYSGWVVTGDTLFIQTDSVDFSKTSQEEPLEFKVYAQAGGEPKTYKIWVNRHQIDPDSLVWGTNPYVTGFSGGAIGTRETKTVALKSDMLVYTTSGTTTMFYSTQNQWAPAVNTNLTIAPVLSSIVNFNDTLYAALVDGTVHRSTDGTSWELTANEPLPAEISTTFKVKTIITTFYDTENKSLDETLACIIEDDLGTSFATATVSNAKKLVWKRGKEVPSGFPTSKLSATKSFATSTGGQQAMLIGPSTDNTTTPWFSDNGLNWGLLEVIAKHALPKWDEPTILYYGNTLYAFGGDGSSSESDFSIVYTSVNGLVWKKITRGFLFPNKDGVSEFKGRTGYSFAVDNDNYIWMTWGKEDEIWKGKLNRLTFK